MAKNNVLRVIKLISAVCTVLILAGFLFYIYVSWKDIPDIKQANDVKNVVPVLVLGSGPAGLSAGMYTARAKFPTVVLSGPVSGGQLTDVRQIENWPGKERMSGIDAIEDLREQAERFSTVILNDSAKKVNLSTWPFIVQTEAGLQLRPLSLIIATGRIAKRLLVPGIQQYWGKGIGTCTICEAPFHKGHVVAVVGGGDTAGDRAQQLAAHAQKVYMIVRNPELDASGTVQDYINATKNITVLYNSELKAVDGNDKTITSATVYNYKTDKIFKFPLKGLYFAIGYHPNSEVIKHALKTDSDGFIILNGRTHQTSVPGVFAGGDIVDKRYGKAGVATGSGIKASLDAIDFLQDIGFTTDTAKRLEPQFFTQAQTKKEIPLITTLQELNQKIRENKGLILIDVYTTYCPSCKSLIPLLKEIASEYAGSLAIFKVDQEKSQDIIKRFQVPSVPYLLLFKNGKLIEEIKGVRTKQDLKSIIESFL